MSQLCEKHFSNDGDYATDSGMTFLILPDGRIKCPRCDWTKRKGQEWEPPAGKREAGGVE